MRTQGTSTAVLVSFLVFFSAKDSGVSHGFFLDWNIFSNPFTQTFSQTFSPRSSRQQNEPAETATIKCFGELGCVENTDEWFHLLHRPINLLPQDRDKVNTRFILFHRNRTVDPIEVYLNRSHLIDSGFDPKKPIKFITHGYIDTGFSFWVIKLAQSLLVAGDFNVFVVDWGGGSLSLYTQATANTRLVGLEIAHYYQFLHREFPQEVKPENVHCIGHSLGSHVCGYAGGSIRGLGRITGLDPAEPYFQYMPEHVRLSPDDAKFVDVIHTDGRTILLLGYGMIQPCGHIDFYPNDGKEQPGCELTEIPMNLLHSHGYEEAQRELFACNHHRAIYYFIEAVLNRCQYVGHMCEDYWTYLKGDCWSCGVDGSLCALMGLDADKYSIGNRSFVTFYVSTAKTSPFCVRHYRVSIQLAWPQQAADWVQGKLKISIDGTSGSMDNINLTPNENARLHHGTNVSFMVQNPKDIGDIQRVKLEWKYDHGYLDLMSTCWSYVCNNKLFIKRIEVMDMDNLRLFPSSEPELEKENQEHKAHGEESQEEVKAEKRDERRLGTLASPLSKTLCGEEGTKYTGVQSGSYAFFERAC